MVVSLKHSFVSAKGDGPDLTLVQPSNWNEEHVLQQATARLLGRTDAGTGPTGEIAVSGHFTLSGGTLSLSGLTPTELGYLSGVTSSIQAQIDNQTHPISDIVNLQTTLNGIQTELDTHVHPISEVTGLQAQLDAKTLKTTTVTAGGGLTGGGDLATNRTFALGSPGTISATSTNIVTGTSHNHAINMGAGSGLDADLLDGYQSSMGTGGNTVAVRTSSGDIQARLMRSTYAAATSISSAAEIIMQVNQGADNFHRPITASGFINWFRAHDGSGSGVDSDTVDGVHASSFARKTTNIAAGNGLSGGGTIGASRTISMGTPGTLTTGTSNSTSGSSHTHALSGVASTSTSISAGNGLTGGGNLAGNRTITLGHPGSITSTSSNSVSSISHTHSLSEFSVRLLISQAPAGEVGTYAFLVRASGRAISVGDTFSGSGLRYFGVVGSNAASALYGGGFNGTPSGTWRAMGGSMDYSRTATLFLRIS